MTKLAIGINLHRCIGCNTCAVACKMQNNVPDGMLWNRVLTEGCERFDSAEGTEPFAHVSAAGMPALREPGVRARVPHGCHL